MCCDAQGPKAITAIVRAITAVLVPQQQQQLYFPWLLGLLKRHIVIFSSIHSIHYYIKTIFLLHCQQNASKMPAICQQNASNMRTKCQQNASKMPATSAVLALTPWALIQQKKLSKYRKRYICKLCKYSIRLDAKHYLKLRLKLSKTLPLL